MVNAAYLIAYLMKRNKIESASASSEMPIAIQERIESGRRRRRCNSCSPSRRYPRPTPSFQPAIHWHSSSFVFSRSLWVSVSFFMALRWWNGLTREVSDERRNANRDGESTHRVRRAGGVGPRATSSFAPANLFGGGDCDLRLEHPESPLDGDIEIHAAPRGKRTQRIHLLSSGERVGDGSRRGGVAKLDERRLPLDGLARGELLLQVRVDSKAP